MNLYIPGTVLNSDYNDENGKTLYKVSTPLSLGNKTSTITRLIHSSSESESGEEDQQDVPEGRFAHLARIEFKAVGHSVIHYKGAEFDTKETFRQLAWWRTR